MVLGGRGFRNVKSSGLFGVGGASLLAQENLESRLVLFHQEEEPSMPSPNLLATAEPNSSATDQEVVSPVVAAATTSSSMEEEPGPDRAATPPVWERGGYGGTQQGASPAPDGCQPGPGPSPVSGTSEDLRPPRRRPPPGDL